MVSHSRALADAALGLAAEMVAEDNRPVIAVAAGLDETTFGTDAAAVAEAIAAADSPDGVLVLLDLGSAVLSAELALEFVDPEIAERVVLSSAPLVEGLVAAVVTASTGASLQAVADEAKRGLLGKQDHLGDVPTPSATVATDNEQSVEVLVSNEHGLHARPAARLVALVNSFDASVTLTDLDTGRGPIDAGSLSMVATLNAQQGHRLRVGASGPQADEALDAVRVLAEQAFGDLPAGALPQPVLRGGSGLDVAIGPAIVWDTAIDLSTYQRADAATEASNSETARTAAIAELAQVQRETTARVGAAEAGIFEAQAALLADPAQLREITAAIDRGASAPEAWSQTLDDLAKTVESLDDPYQRERAQDVRSVRDRVLRLLTGTESAEPPADGVLVVRELDAATAAILDAERIAGIAIRATGTTGHGVIVARSRGIPLITGIGDVQVPLGSVVAFDARANSFMVDPDEEAFRTTIRERTAEREQALATADHPAVTTDGRVVPVMANVGSVQDARDARGADGSGLVRTEVLFGDRRTAPTTAEQAEVFRKIAAAFEGKPITIRTWDIGGDKPLPFLPQAAEANPFLGERGLRVFRHRPELLRDQLQAVREVALETPVQVMFPMVTTAEEVAWGIEILDALGPQPAGLKVGIMVEVPAAALRIDSLALGLDFVSIGTNDLTQYTTAADRTNTAVAALADGLDPAVLLLIDHVVRHVPTGVHVAVCGDLASDPSAAALLVGLGVHELSAVGPQIPLVKARIRRISFEYARHTAAEALTQSSAADVRYLLGAVS
ncbi:phosphocarrier protein FPr [Kribbella sp. VKM Ac-2527]|uniref:Phosphocarrier protein HPr n=1 Tax=Kribbella caucasensis TaxID=2512215 RepID=A0A4R6KP54_9ACTN|nr:phosphocarrier protein FPr [Kribbella sp. VKM Ac-2527]